MQNLKHICLTIFLLVKVIAKLKEVYFPVNINITVRKGTTIQQNSVTHRPSDLQLYKPYGSLLPCRNSFVTT
jgi:hypothetical protein